MPAFPKSFPLFPPLGLKWVFRRIKSIHKHSSAQFQDVPTGFVEVNHAKRVKVEEEGISQSQEVPKEEQEAFILSKPDEEVKYQQQNFNLDLSCLKVSSLWWWHINNRVSTSNLLLWQAHVEMVPLREIPLLKVKLGKNCVIFTVLDFWFFEIKTKIIRLH